MSSLNSPLTPPPSVDNIPSASPEGFTLLPIESDQDNVPSLEHWLQSRCPTLDVNHLLHTHNRVTIPIEEDFKLLRRLKKTLQALPDSDSERAMIQAMKGLKNTGAESDERCRDSVYQHFYSSYELPPTLDGIWWSLLRSKSLLSINDTISQLLPHLFEQVNGLEARDDLREEFPRNEPGSLKSKRTGQKFRVAKSKTPKSQGSRKTQPTGLRRSSRLKST